MADIEHLPRDIKDDIQKVVIREEGDFQIQGIAPISRQAGRNENNSQGSFLKYDLLYYIILYYKLQIIKSGIQTSV